ncbi:double-stranded RNA-specific editase 1-like isoform X2 [Zootermopsis nevadensis]|uniref:double-stranded RNA-specific editase 1-like isoform X2 n=1 Tax=Zootermopsis nevadensis TaxID=136037 RepID=UPI000B8EC943|nr:double-stranded RNA-specific editase 1-like isoform X2 [Zootermopsis nevadensis]
MSYSTRRQTGQGMGVGRGSAQVLYHQQQRSVPGRMQQSPGPNPPQHGYNTQQPIQTVSVGYSTQQNTPAYTTQSQPQPQTQQPSSGGSTPQGYSSQQYQNQQQSPTPAQQQQQPPLPPQQQQQQQPSPQQQPELMQAAIKAESAAPTPSSSMEVEVGSEGPTEGGGETAKVKSWQLKKKMPGFKINKKVKKRRQNARLRKLLQPKNAIMVLNELKTGIKFTFQEHTNALTQTMFVVNAEVDGKIHTGQGLSKPLAKQNAAENALKALLLEKMAQAAIKVEGSELPEPVQEDTNNDTGSTANTEGSDEMSDSGRSETPEDEVPWGSLASFALYKLFTDWQSQGTHVPIPKQTAVPATKQIQTAPAPMKKIPENPTDRHPVMLLNQMRPGIQFTEISREGTPPNLTFTLGVTVDGKSYTGVAKNKKDAKKEAAKAALAGSLNIFYD